MGFFFSYFLALGAAWGLAQGGAFTWTGLFLIFGLVAVLDESWGDCEISSRFWRKFWLHPRVGEFALLMSFPFLLGFLGFAMWKISSMASAWEIAGAVISVGIFFGVLAINTAHELVHRRSNWQKFLGVLNLSLVNFGWFQICHVEIHHRWVATDKDPASARFDEKLWPFWWRNFWGSLKGSFLLESSRHGFGLRNRFWIYLGLHVLWAFLIFAMGFWISESPESGLFLFLMWLAISVIAILMLKTVDYIEHKGLSRALGADGRAEAVRAQHSWDSYHFFTNLMLFNLGLHANHHLKASLEFSSLGRTEGARRMRFGYAVMVLRAILGVG